MVAQLGSLFLNEQDRVIKLLFHFGTPGLRPATVLLFAVVFLVMECITLGMWVCSGLFIPSLLVGAAMGENILLAAYGMISRRRDDTCLYVLFQSFNVRSSATKLHRRGNTTPYFTVVMLV